MMSRDHFILGSFQVLVLNQWSFIFMQVSTSGSVIVKTILVHLGLDLIVSSRFIVDDGGGHLK